MYSGSFAIAGTLRAGRARGDAHLACPKVSALFAASDDAPRLAIAGTLRALPASDDAHLACPEVAAHLVALFGL